MRKRRMRKMLIPNPDKPEPQIQNIIPIDRDKIQSSSKIQIPSRSIVGQSSKFVFEIFSLKFS